MHVLDSDPYILHQNQEASDNQACGWRSLASNACMYTQALQITEIRYSFNRVAAV